WRRPDRYDTRRSAIRFGTLAVGPGAGHVHAVRVHRSMNVTSWLAGVLGESSILSLFVVIGLGFLLGEVSFFGLRFGVAGVLFAGLALGSLSPLVTVPEAVSTLGLVLFVYAMGVSSGRAFFDAFRRRYRENALAASVLIVGGLVTFALARVLGLSAPVASGLYCGALTNTPALAAVQERVRERGGVRASRSARQGSLAAAGARVAD